LQLGEARRLGLEPSAQRFQVTVPLRSEQNAVTVRATAPNGETATAQTAPRIGRKWAVIVGVGNQHDEIAEHPQAARDARSVYEFLRSPAAGPFQADHLVLLTGEQATAAAIREALFVFLAQAEPEDLVVFYFAGQSTPDPLRPDNLYLLAHDTDARALAATALPMWDVKTALRRRIRAERLIVLADLSHGANPASTIQHAFADLFTPSNRMVLTASSALDRTDERQSDRPNGIFTHSLIEGLKGWADVDKNGIVTFNEVADFVSGKVRLETSGKQSPMRSGLGDIPLAEVPAQRGAHGSGAR
jgi:hypothetical protein